MKQPILIFLLFIVTGVTNAQNIDSFLGIPFSMPPWEVKRAMKTKNAIEDTTFNKEYYRTDMLKFSNVSIGGRTCVDFTVTFVNEKAAQAEFIFAPDPESTTVKFYGDLVTDIGKTYGHCENSRDFSTNYKRNEDKDVIGLKAGMIKYTSTWNDQFDNLIITTVLPDANAGLLVKLTYRNTTLYKGHQTRQTDKASEF
jgi:hypothetical protein